MAKCIVARLPLVGAALLVSLAVAAGPAWARVGVTSATDGDPLGKPPSEAERVLRIGIDVQANELVTTNANDRAHLVFLDGTSVTVGPNARLVIDKFIYDPDTKKGELALTASTGVFRLVGGKISKSSAITVVTPSSTIGIRGGITIFSVTSFRTISNFIFGNSMTVTGGGQTQTTTRPGSQVIVNSGSPPGLPSLLPPGGLVNDMTQLETGKTTTTTGADQGTQSSGFSSQNSGQTPFTPPGTGNPTNNTQQQATNAVTGSNTQKDDNQPPPNNTPPPPPPAPLPKTTRTMNGYASGLIVAQNGSTSTTRAPEVLLNKPTDVTIKTDAQTGMASGTIIIRGLDGTLFSPTATLQLGTMVNNGNNFFTDDLHYAVTTSDDPNRKSTVKAGSNTFNLPNSSALVSGPVNAAGSQPVQVIGTPGPCACEYLTWGYWQSSINYTTGYRAGQTDTITAAPYVAGVLATSVQLPQTGSATYTGFMVGNVQNGASFYNAAGSYNSAWNFAARVGNFNGSFDSANYAGVIVAQPGSGGVSFLGGMIGAGRVGTVSGSFFSAPGDAAKYQAGAFTIGQGSSTYKASGVFAGQR